MEVLEIIEGIQNKKPKAQKALVTKYSGLLYSICRRYCYRQMDARDVLQDSFVMIFKNFHMYDISKGSLDAWIKKVTVNVALQHNRSTKIIPMDIIENKDSLEEVQPDALNKLGEEELINVIAQLPDQYRMVFNLYVIDGYSHKEIGQQLGITDATSRSNLSRAKSILRNKIIDIEKHLPCQSMNLKKK